MLPAVNIAAIDHLADIEAVLKEMRERANAKTAAADCAAVRQPPRLATDPPTIDVLGQRTNGAKLEIARKDGAHRFRLGRDHHDLLVHRGIAERDRTPNPDALALGSKDQAETSVLFELIGMRYERRSLLITANQPSPVLSWPGY